MMRTGTLIRVFLIILLQGCYSLYTLDERERGQIAEDLFIMITLTDSSLIEVEPWHHVNVTKPSAFVYGFGKKVHPYTKTERQFRGKLPRESIDSLKIVKVGILNNVTCYLPDSTLIHFQGKDNIMITTEDSTGLYCIGLLQAPRLAQKTMFSGRVPSRDVKQLEVEKISSGKTIALVVYIAASIAAIPALVALSNWGKSLK